jgi:hypothetical protein
VLDEKVSAAAARERYGVVLTEAGELDLDATDRERESAGAAGTYAPLDLHRNAGIASK